jgi:hypothetical protein
MLKMPLNIAIFGAFLLIVAVLGFFLWQTLFLTKQHGHSPENSEPAYSEQQPSKEHSLRTSSSQGGHNPTEEAIAEYTKWLAIFTLFLVLATIALFISGERNVGVAYMAADAAQKSTHIAGQALISSQRPVVSLKGIAHRSIMNQGQVVSWIVTPVMENTGSTPGVGFITTTNFVGQPKELPDDYPFPDFDRPAQHEANIIGPKQTRDLADIVLPAQFLTNVAEGKTNIFIYGWVEYRSVFGHTYRTEFSARVKIVGNVSRDDAIFSFPSTGKYNNMDNDCKYKSFIDVPVERPRVETTSPSQP